MEKLILFGDSWSCGEWDLVSNKKISISHPGLTEYLLPDYKVLNLGRAGSSLWQTLYAVRNYLALYKDNAPIRVIVFQTDAFRDEFSQKFDVNYSELYSSCDDLKHFYHQVLRIFYIKLAEISSTYNTEIYLSGGLTDIDTKTLQMYPNLNLLCESWIRLLDSHHTPSMIPLQIDRRMLPVVKSHKREDLCDQLITSSDQNFLFYQELIESKYFGKLFGDFHPTREGHQIMSNYIKSFFKVKINA